MAFVLLVALAELMLAGSLAAQNSNTTKKDAPPPAVSETFGTKPTRLELRPRDSFVSVRTTQIFLVTAYDDKKLPVRKAKVLWSIQGDGTVVATADADPAATTTQGNIRQATGLTATKEYTKTVEGVTFIVHPGQTWIALRSSVEGQTVVGAECPDMERDTRKKVAKIVWVDAKWKLPTAIGAKAGSEVILKAQVTRRDDTPLQGYFIRYRLLAGPSASWVGSAFKTNPDEGIAVTGPDGLATIRLSQSQAITGVDRIAIDVARPDSASGSNMILGKGEVAVTWRAADITAVLQVPEFVPVNEDFTATLAITNNGGVESQRIFARLNPPLGTQVTWSSERATRDGEEILWSLPGIPAGRQFSLQVKMRGNNVGVIHPVFNLRPGDGQPFDAFADVTISKAQLLVQLKGPETAILDESLPFELTIKNIGSGPAQNVGFHLVPDPGLTPSNGDSNLKQAIESLAAGSSKTVLVSLKAEKTGAFSVKADAQAAGIPFTPADPLTVHVGNPQITVSVKGPQQQYVNQPVDWSIHVENPEDVDLDSVTLRATLPPEVKFSTADKDGKLANGVVEWNLGTVAKKQSIEVRVSGVCTSVTSQAMLTATVSAEPLVKREGIFRTASLSKVLRAEASAPSALDILGVPALHMEVTDSDDPVKVGNRTTYSIRIRNSGSLTATKLKVDGVLTANLKPLTVYGYRADERGEVNGQKVWFPICDALQPGQEIVYRVEAEAVKEGNGKLTVNLRGQHQSKPIVVEEMTGIRPGN